MPNAVSHESKLGAGDFFASRAGVCVYVKGRRGVFRVQFAAPDAHGVVQDDDREGAAEALEVARAALRRHATQLAPLFEEVARKRT